MTEEDRSPQITKTAFACPHCGVYTTQYWYQAHALRITGDEPLPLVYTSTIRDTIRSDDYLTAETKQKIYQRLDTLDSGEPFFDSSSEHSTNRPVSNLHISSCYNCNRNAIWVHDRLVHPPVQTGPLPNPEMPDSVRADYEEARRILNLSTRGACALLRVAIERLVDHLNAKGDTLNEKIGDLVKHGLSTTVQQSLDSVRVIGSQAVHPGTLDLHDDPQTATGLLYLTNEIVEEMIAKPKRVRDIYEKKVPGTKKEQIKKRDSKKD